MHTILFSIVCLVLFYDVYVTYLEYEMQPKVALRVVFIFTKCNLPRHKCNLLRHKCANILQFSVYESISSHARILGKKKTPDTQHPTTPNTAVYNNISSKQHANVLQARPRESDVLLG